MFFKKIYDFGDRLEDKVRGYLSHYPIIYAFIGGAGIIIFWRGIWHTVDYLIELFAGGQSILDLVWWDGPLSIVVGTSLLLLVGLFVTSFIGNEIILSGLKKEKKLTEKTEEEVEVDISESEKIKREIYKMNSRLKKIEELLSRK